MATMVYLLDTNVLIEADRDYYELPRVPEFWEWLLWNAENGVVAVPYEVYNEVEKRKGSGLKEWMVTHRKSLLYSAEADPALVQKVVRRGYAVDLNDREIERLKADPIPISYGLARPGEVTIVTNEVSAPSRQRGNRKVPDVCDDLKAPHMRAFDLFRKLDFRTNWRARTS